MDQVKRPFKNFIPLITDLVWLTVVVIALVAFYGFLFLLVGLKVFIPLITDLVWPTVVVIALIIFRKPLADFLRGIAGRATKLSITSFFTIELSLPEASYPQLGQFLSELQAFASGLESANVPSAPSYLYDLFTENKALDYMVVDLGTGQQWLTSRLFIFALMLKRMRGLRCLVFLGTSTYGPRSFLAACRREQSSSPPSRSLRDHVLPGTGRDNFLLVHRR